MKPDWIDLGPLADFPLDAPVLRKDASGRRYACVRAGASVEALDDRCPHQGYPLSQGRVQGGVLTCAWHNWKFELGTGACTFGGEPVRRYPTRVEDGRVHLDRALDRGAEARRILASLRAALSRDEMGRALRDGLRLGDLGLAAPGAPLGPLELAMEVVARDGAERAEYGFDHGLAVLTDLCSWAERGWIKVEEAFVQGAHAIAEPNLHLGVRGAGRTGVKADPRASLSRLEEHDAADLAPVAAALEAERRDEAEARVREIVEARGPEGACDALLPFVAQHVYDYGHGAIFLAKGLELAKRFPAAAPDILGAVTAMLAWATADTALPPFAATREALARLAEMKGGEGRAAPLADRAAYEGAVLSGEREAVKATLERLGQGVSAVALLRATAHAAAVRVRRFDSAWEQRLDAEEGVLSVTHAVTFAESAIALTAGNAARAGYAAQLAILAAGFVGKLRHADAAQPIEGAREASGELLSAVRARDVERALGLAKGLTAEGRREAYREIAPFAALEAVVLPIRYAHTVKVSEALRRLEEADAEGDGAYLEALLAYLVPVRPENLARRTAAVAVKFMRDGKPPEGLY